MSHDVQIQYRQGDLCFVPRVDVASALEDCGFKKVNDDCWHAKNPYMEAYPTVVDDDGELDDETAKRCPDRINRIDTHVPWDVIRESQGAAQRLRIALARRLGWVAVDRQLDKVVASPVTGSLGGLDPVGGLDLNTKQTIAMDLLHNSQKRARPKGRITGKSSNDGNCRSLVSTSNGEWMLGLSSGYAGGKRQKVLQFRDKDLNLTGEIEDVGQSICLHPGGERALTSGLCVEGYEAETCLVDIENRVVSARFPVIAPFVWDSEHTFCALSPSFKVELIDQEHVYTDPRISQSLLTPEYETLLMDKTKRVLRVDVRTSIITDVHAESLNPERLAISSDYKSLFVGSRSELYSLNTATGEVMWRQVLGKCEANRVQDLAVSPCGNYVAAVTHSLLHNYPNECVVVEQSSGNIVLAIALTGLTQPETIVWHPSGWLATAGSNGQVLNFDLSGSMRLFKGAPKSIRSLAFSDEGLLVAGREKQIRVYPFLSDER